MSRQHAWEQQAANWVAWTRTPGHDVFPHYWPSFEAEILPPPRGRTLEAGCGEGRVSRALASLGQTVTAVDASPTLVRHAADADAASRYAIADATALPFADGAFDIVVAYNVLQALPQLDDMPRAVREAARVLAPGGHLCLCVAHPMTDVGRLDATTGQLIITGSYFERREVDEAATRDGLTMQFHGWTYALEDYARAIDDAGLVIDRVREPLPAVDAPALERWRLVPLFLSMRARKLAG